MFAARTRNDENAVYERQTLAASKPLNQGVKGLAPKTPSNKTAPKTPFRKQQNDENVFQGGAKTQGKGKQAGLFGDDSKASKADGDAFLTPAAPRTAARAPLGNKTTNAKARGLQTPAPPATEHPVSLRGTSPRLRRAKVKIHQAEVDPLHNDDDDVPDVEYMPPREVPLPDYPSDDDLGPINRTYPQLQGANLTRGWPLAMNPPKEEATLDAEEAELFQRQLREADERERKAQHKRQPPTLTSKTAASALSSSNNEVPNFAAPTATSQSRAGMSFAPLKPRKPLTATTSTSNPRHTAAKAASNTTLGYSKGRAVSSNRTPSLSDIYKRPASAARATEKKDGVPFVGGTTVDQLLGLHISTPEVDEEMEREEERKLREVLDGDDTVGFQLEEVEDV